MPTSVVTGGAGFLGSHLCARLLQEGHRVICIDNLITGSTANVSPFTSNPQFQFVNLDVTNFISIEEKVDFIFHFASPASPIDYLKLPIQTLKVGSLGTHKALGLAKAKGARFLLASTSEVYGDPLVHPQSEEYWGNVNPVGPRGVYDEAKRFAEAMTMAYHQYHRLDTRIARIFNTYGEQMRIDDGRAIPTFMAQALKGEQVTVFGEGSQTRSVCYVSDLIEGIYRLMMSDYTLPMNIGNPEEVTVLALAKEILDITKSRSAIVFRPLPQDDPKIRQPDIAKAKDMLAWKPTVSRTDGLHRTMEYFRQKLGIKS
ncbi:MAG TPA: UDP-glucuronic acid decarboxylase family protein [Bacteroidota bacterium]